MRMRRVRSECIRRVWPCAVVIVAIAGCSPDGHESGDTPSEQAFALAANTTCVGFTGSQLTGTALPVVAGPASGTVSPGAALPVLGIAVTDPDAAANTGAMVVHVSTTAGTVSMTVNGAPIAGSGTAHITYNGSFAAIN